MMTKKQIEQNSNASEYVSRPAGTRNDAKYIGQVNGFGNIKSKGTKRLNS